MFPEDAVRCLYLVIKYKETPLTTAHLPNFHFLRTLALHAGILIKNNPNPGRTCEFKSDKTPVTPTDVQINQFAIDQISQHFPLIQVFGEEGNHDVAGATHAIVIDPIDGTRAYIAGLPLATFVVSLIEIETGRALEAIIYDPYQSQMWHTTRGENAFLNELEEPLKVSSHSALEGAHICIPCWRDAEYNIQRIREKLTDAGATCFDACTIAYFGGYVASGRCDATIFPARTGLETFAMQLIVEGAGGKVTDMFGKPMSYGPGPKFKIDGHIISNGVLHEQLVELVASCQ